MHPMDLIPFLRLMASKRASDLFFSTGARPSIKIEGRTYGIGERAVTAVDIEGMALSVLTPAQKREFEEELELNLAYQMPEHGRFRINLYRQKGDVGLVVRFISHQVPKLDELNLPPALKEFASLKRGLVLVVGATGSGKSTTLAALLDHRNATQTGHILSIEDPIEYLHHHQMSVVDQREIGIDTHSYGKALKNALRQAPDVILIGEIRDRDTMQHAIAYAETGHLCLSTLHANTAAQALERVVNFFPDTARQQLLLDLSLNLQGVVGQRLVHGNEGRLIPAVEVLKRTALIANLMEKGDIDGIKTAMKQGAQEGMQTFDDALFKLYSDNRISAEEAISQADSRTDLSLRIRLGASLAGKDVGREVVTEKPPAPVQLALDTGRKFGIDGRQDLAATQTDEFGRPQPPPAPNPWGPKRT
jgi:twitching motility protein PilU